MSEDYKIEVDIPVPSLSYKTDGWLKLYDKMNVGDSILFKDYFKGRQFCGAIQNYRGKGNLRSHILNKQNHVRVWRILNRF